jgi:hypothetical protein
MILQSRSALILWLIFCFFGISACSVFAEEPSSIKPSINYTFEDLGFKTKTYSGTQEQVLNLSFNSTSKNPKAALFPHFLVINGAYAKIKINNATLFSEYISDGKEYRGEMLIPSGMIEKGTNTISIGFKASRSFTGTVESYEITVLEDSTIGIE